MKKLNLIIALSLLSFSLASAQLSAEEKLGFPNCENLRGVWENQIGSVMDIITVDPIGGAITGRYVSPQGGGPAFRQLIGWNNGAPVNESDPCSLVQNDNVKVITFTVSWGDLGSITAWTGTCRVENGIPTIHTLWHLVRPNTEFVWDHIHAGSDTFIPKFLKDDK